MTSSSQDSNSANGGKTFSVSNFTGYPLLSQSGLRYPTVQSAPLIYSAVMAGQPLFPWRPFSALTSPTPVSVSPNVSVLSSGGSSSITTPLGPFVQFPTYPYLPLAPSLFNQQQVKDEKDKHIESPCIKYVSEDMISSPEHTPKRIKLENSIATSSRCPQQSSPVVKLVNYALSESVTPNGSPLSLDSSTIHSANVLETQNDVSLSSNIYASVYSDILLVKCFGLLDESVIDQHKLKVTDVLEELYCSFLYLSTSSSIPLPYETCVMATLSYLNSLSEGETISLDLLQFFLQYVRTSETVWLQYHRKHKKMSESTFVQSQFIHFLKLSVQSNTNQVCVVVSQSSLNDGINIAMSGLKKTNPANCPKIIAVLALHQGPSTSCIDFCLLLIDKVLSKSLFESNKITPSLVINQELLLSIHRSRQTLEDSVHCPFQVPNLSVVINSDKAEKLVPTLPHVIEHRPIGPFPNECNVAYYLLQRVLSSDQLERYQDIGFYVLSPYYPPLLSQLVKDVAQSGLVDTCTVESIVKHIVPNNTSAIESMIDRIKSCPNTLFVVIVKSAHVTCTIMNENFSLSNDSKEILNCHENTIILNLSAHPYVLQTKYSLVSPSCEIYWPSLSKKLDNESASTSCSSQVVFQSALSNSGVNDSELSSTPSVREDPQFEKLVSEACNKDRTNSSISYIRAQILLSDYIKALLNSISPSEELSTALPETQILVNKLVNTPLSNGRGHGFMILVRCHDDNVAKDFYTKLKAVRNVLGLQYRFEICFDNGRNQLVLSEHFSRRVHRTNSSSVSNVDQYGLSYEELCDLPCLIVLSGQLLPSARMPKSLLYLDLRALHMSQLTRTTYESDLSYLNHYVYVPKQTTCASPTLSSCCSAEPTASRQISSNIIEWKPSLDKSIEGSSSSHLAFEYNSNNGEMDCTEMNGNHHKQGIAIVEIPQPVDQLTSNDEIIPNTDKVQESLLNSLEDFSDMEEEDLEETLPLQTICLLSRQYYHIWENLHSVSRAYLLPPSDGVVWEAAAGHRRLPLLDHTFSGQSSYYRNWSKPERKSVCSSLESILKLQVKGINRRFLLTGPASVGKLQSCLLFIRLLKDYMRSSQAISTISQHPLILPLTKTLTHSHVLKLDQLKHGLLNQTSSASLTATNNTTHSTVLMTVPFSVAYSITHSCPQCNTTTNGLAVDTHSFTSKIPFSETHTVTINWNIPTHKLNSISALHSNNNNVLDFIKFSSQPTIFSLSLDYQDDAILNISHTASPDTVHVIITKQSSMETCKSSWYDHIIAGIPDELLCGIGSTLEVIRRLAIHLYKRNIQERVESAVSPWLLMCNDHVCMVHERRKDRDKNVPLYELLPQLCNQYSDCTAVTVPHWCSTPVSDVNLSLDHNFLLLNLQHSTDLHFNPMNYKSALTDFHFHLLFRAHHVAIATKYCYIRKEPKENTNREQDLPAALESQPDRLVTSLHHDSSSLFDISGSLLLETFLLHKSSSFFPSSMEHPVLMIDNYINLGPNITTVLIPVEQLQECMTHSFSGLVLYLCEGRVSAEMLQQLEFISGACLLLVTSDCKGLVKEVSRLDLEEKWQFKLRDEFQTACHDKHHPLFFLTGKFNGKTND